MSTAIPLKIWLTGWPLPSVAVWNGSGRHRSTAKPWSGAARGQKTLPSPAYGAQFSSAMATK